ncbi:hypothetical protein IHE33_15755 (plasmid) [Mycetohabitans endofungorum]|uniref:hypothetical protein n=1 Tax=Mycetohabitans endofungorum TaxID=417203 RepID=UPI0030D35153
MLKTETGRFVKLIASIDSEKGEGKILYVNPSTVATRPEGAASAAPSPFDAFDISIQDSGGQELRRFRPAIQVSSCADDKLPKTALVNEDIPVIPGMKRIALLYNGTEVSCFEAAEPRAASEIAGGLSPLSIDAPLPGKPNRSVLRTQAAAPQDGVTYTVQVCPAGESTWQTIAVGRETPHAEIDRNQFPGVKTAKVRVLRSTGFEDELFSEQEVDLNY